jgi:phospholipase C
MDGWLRAGMNDDYAIGYYEEADRPFFNALARNFTTCDRFFASIMAETYPNRIFQHAAQTDRLTNTLDVSTLPTIWDRLAEHAVSARYYFSDVPFLLLWGARYASITRPAAEFFADAAAGTLPGVAFVDPRFINDETGTSGSDHPHADVRVGDAFLEDAFNAVSSGPIGNTPFHRHLRWMGWMFRSRRAAARRCAERCRSRPRRRQGTPGHAGAGGRRVTVDAR